MTVFGHFVRISFVNRSVSARMRDESESPNLPQPKEDNEDVIARMKRLFLVDRSEESAVETLEKLLALQIQSIDMYVFLLYVRFTL